MNKYAILSFFSVFIAVFFITACDNPSNPQNVQPTYTVTFDSQDATVPATPSTKTVTSPALTIDILPTPPTRLKNTFGGWWTQVNGGGAEFTIVSTVSKNITIYAKWTIAPITYDSQGGSAIESFITPAYGSFLTAPSNPARYGYTFKGWYKESACLNEWNFSSDTLETATILYAKWTPAAFVTLELVNFPDGNYDWRGQFQESPWSDTNLRKITVIGGSGIYTGTNPSKEVIENTFFIFTITDQVGPWVRSWFPETSGNKDDFGTGGKNFAMTVPLDVATHNLKIDGSTNPAKLYVDGVEVDNTLKY